MNKEDPMSERISNDGRDDRWTTPCCYAELGNVGEGNHDCPECGRTVSCVIEYIPSCVAEIGD